MWLCNGPFLERTEAELNIIADEVKALFFRWNILKFCVKLNLNAVFLIDIRDISLLFRGETPNGCSLKSLSPSNFAKSNHLTAKWFESDGKLERHKQTIMVVKRTNRGIFGRVIFWTLFVSAGAVIIFNMVFVLQTASELAILKRSGQDKTTLPSAFNERRTQNEKLAYSTSKGNVFQ